MDLIYGKFTFGVLNTFYQNPNGAFKTIQELGFKVGYDDTDLMKEAGVGFLLKPFAGIYIETSDGNGTDDTYAEVGVAPLFAVHEGKVTLSFPVVLGLSVDDYYLEADGGNALFGYGGVSALATIPLPFPEKYGGVVADRRRAVPSVVRQHAAAVNNGDCLELAGTFISRLFAPGSATLWSVPVAAAIAVVIGLQLLPAKGVEGLQARIERLQPVILGVGLAVVVAFAGATVSSHGVAPFIYFRF